MIRNIALALAALLTLCSSESCKSAGHEVGSDQPSSSRMITRSYSNLSSITALEASSGFDVDYTIGERSEVVVNCSADVADRLDVKVKDGVLHLGLKPCKRLNFKTGTKLKARVTGSDLTVITASSGASVDINSPMTVSGSPLTLTASSGADIEFEAPVSYSSLTATCSSGADINIEGITVSGDITLTCSSGADMEIEAIRAEALTAVASSGATIELTGKATSVNFNASSSGKIKAGKLSADTGSANASSGGSVNSAIKNMTSERHSSGGSIRNN